MQRFALTLVQGARSSGKSTLLDAALARADARRVVRLALSRMADLGGELARLADGPIDSVVAELGGNARPEALADALAAPSPRPSPPVSSPRACALSPRSTARGLDLDMRALQSGFDACLLSTEELDAGPEAWARFVDPFPGWNPGLARRCVPPVAPCW